MSDELSAIELSTEKVHRPLDPASPAEVNACFFNSDDAFNMILEPVPDKVFQDEVNTATARDAKTGYTVCDSALDRETSAPSTSPFLLARYARINNGESLDAQFNTAGSIWYVIEGAGTTQIAGQEIHWGAGDVFLLPGGEPTTLIANGGDAVLWVVTNEPQMAFENARALEISASNIEIVHYRAAEIDRQIERIYDVKKTEETAGLAVMFSSEKQLARRNITPTLTLAMNTLPPGDNQRAHRHNSVAVALIVQGDDCYSMIDGSRKDWAPWVTTVTPPGSLHSHHNRGDKLAKFLIVQDGGLYYHARTMGFSFE